MGDDLDGIDIEGLIIDDQDTVLDYEWLGFLDRGFKIDVYILGKFTFFLRIDNTWQMIHQVARKFVIPKYECTKILSSCLFIIHGHSILILRVQFVDIMTPRVMLSIAHSHSLVHLQLSFSFYKIIFKFHPVGKSGAFQPLTLESDGATEFLNNFLWDAKSKADTTSIDFLSTLDKAKKLEQLTLIFPLDTQASVFNLDLYVGFAIRIVKGVVNGYWSVLLGKFERVWLDIHKDLLKPPPISTNHQRLIRLISTTFKSKIKIEQLTLMLRVCVALISIRIIKNLFISLTFFIVFKKWHYFVFVGVSNELWSKNSFQLDSAHPCFILLDIDHFLDCLSQIEFLNDFSEFTCIDLGKI